MANRAHRQDVAIPAYTATIDPPYDELPADIRGLIIATREDYDGVPPINYPALKQLMQTVAFTDLERELVRTTLKGAVLWFLRIASQSRTYSMPERFQEPGDVDLSNGTYDTGATGANQRLMLPTIEDCLYAMRNPVFCTYPIYAVLAAISDIVRTANLAELTDICSIYKITKAKQRMKALWNEVFGKDSSKTRQPVSRFRDWFEHDERTESQVPHLVPSTSKVRRLFDCWKATVEVKMVLTHTDLNGGWWCYVQGELTRDIHEPITIDHLLGKSVLTGHPLHDASMVELTRTPVRLLQDLSTITDVLEHDIYQSLVDRREMLDPDWFHLFASSVPIFLRSVYTYAIQAIDFKRFGSLPIRETPATPVPYPGFSCSSLEVAALRMPRDSSADHLLAYKPAFVLLVLQDCAVTRWELEVVLEWYGVLDAGHTAAALFDFDDRGLRRPDFLRRPASCLFAKLRYFKQAGQEDFFSFLIRIWQLPNYKQPTHEEIWLFTDYARSRISERIFARLEQVMPGFSTNPGRMLFPGRHEDGFPDICSPKIVRKGDIQNIRLCQESEEPGESMHTRNSLGPDPLDADTPYGAVTASKLVMGSPPSLGWCIARLEPDSEDEDWFRCRIYILIRGFACAATGYADLATWESVIAAYGIPKDHLSTLLHDAVPPQDRKEIFSHSNAMKMLSLLREYGKNLKRDNRRQASFPIEQHWTIAPSAKAQDRFIFDRYPSIPEKRELDESAGLYGQSLMSDMHVRLYGGTDRSQAATSNSPNHFTSQQQQPPGFHHSDADKGGDANMSQDHNTTNDGTDGNPDWLISFNYQVQRIDDSDDPAFWIGGDSAERWDEEFARYGADKATMQAWPPTWRSWFTFDLFTPDMTDDFLASRMQRYQNKAVSSRVSMGPIVYFALHGFPGPDHLPPAKTRLEDIYVGMFMQLVEARDIPKSMLARRHPEDFDGQGIIRYSRHPVGRGHYTQGADGQWYPTLVRGCIILMGSEHLRQLLLTKKWTSGHKLPWQAGFPEGAKNVKSAYKSAELFVAYTGYGVMSPSVDNVPSICGFSGMPAAFQEVLDENQNWTSNPQLSFAKSRWHQRVEDTDGEDPGSQHIQDPFRKKLSTPAFSENYKAQCREQPGLTGRGLSQDPAPYDSSAFSRKPLVGVPVPWSVGNYRQNNSVLGWYKIKEGSTTDSVPSPYQRKMLQNPHAASTHFDRTHSHETTSTTLTHLDSTHSHVSTSATASQQQHHHSSVNANSTQEASRPSQFTTLIPTNSSALPAPQTSPVHNAEHDRLKNFLSQFSASSTPESRTNSAPVSASAQPEESNPLDKLGSLSPDLDDQNLFAGSGSSSPDLEDPNLFGGTGSPSPDLEDPNLFGGTGSPSPDLEDPNLFGGTGSPSPDLEDPNLFGGTGSPSPDLEDPNLFGGTGSPSPDLEDPNLFGGTGSPSPDLEDPNLFGRSAPSSPDLEDPSLFGTSVSLSPLQQSSEVASLAARLSIPGATQTQTQLATKNPGPVLPEFPTYYFQYEPGSTLPRSGVKMESPTEKFNALAIPFLQDLQKSKDSNVEKAARHNPGELATLKQLFEAIQDKDKATEATYGMVQACGKYLIKIWAKSSKQDIGPGNSDREKPTASEAQAVVKTSGSETPAASDAVHNGSAPGAQLEHVLATTTTHNPGTAFPKFVDAVSHEVVYALQKGMEYSQELAYQHNAKNMAMKELRDLILYSQAAKKEDPDWQPTRRREHVYQTSSEEIRKAVETYTNSDISENFDEIPCPWAFPPGKRGRFEEETGFRLGDYYSDYSGASTPEPVIGTDASYGYDDMDDGLLIHGTDRQASSSAAPPFSRASGLQHGRLEAGPHHRDSWVPFRTGQYYKTANSTPKASIPDAILSQPRIKNDFSRPMSQPPVSAQARTSRPFNLRASFDPASADRGRKRSRHDSSTSTAVSGADQPTLKKIKTSGEADTSAAAGQRPSGKSEDSADPK
ncbi:Chitin biosynthesis protein CHS5 [Elsinoe australis]|uniref:Chitin biosynthesis protein CHS5 n=1 Tax=Elsinoe australis TaxID=40998 RepID=A0A2P8A8R7_9PEZI|nr:Chitin biosynthesis protein CHS5 [Elsinoe australis]